MNCARRKWLHLSMVLFFFSVVLCSLCQPTKSARPNGQTPLPQVGKDLEEDSKKGFEVIARGTQELKEPLTTTHTTTDQVMTKLHSVHQLNTADHRASHLTPPLPQQTFVHWLSVTPEPFTITADDPTPAETPGETQNIRSKDPADLFSIKDRRQGWVILHIIGVMYMFLSLVIVSDKFFIPALGVITDKLAIADNVTGATFMAAGVSAPKLSAILIGVFVIRGDVFFFGTVVCVAAFNNLFVLGMCALFSRGILHLNWWPLLRDTSFFILYAIIVMIFVLDSVIMWWESMLLVFCYGFYLLFMKFNKQIQQVFKTQPHQKNVDVISVKEQGKKCVSEDPDLQQGPSIALSNAEENEEDHKKCVKNDHKVANEIREEDGRNRPLSLDWPDTRLKQATYLFLLPIIFPLWLTLPDVCKQKSRKLFVVTFLVSILWIAVFSYFMAWWARQVCETFSISDLVVTSLAAEMSIPGLITSVIVARKGLGDMAVSSSMGSNIFSITVCLPVSWLLISAFHGFAPVPVNSSGLFCMIVLLLLPLLYVFISIASCKWKLNKVLGWTMLLFYTIFQLVRVMFQYKFIVCPV